MLFTPETWEMLANIVTVVGLPFAVWVFLMERRKERQIEQEEIYQRLSDEYTEFMKLVIENADLRLMATSDEPDRCTPEQIERRTALFSILVALFERAYLLVYETEMNPETARLWQSWEDYMREWCRRSDFRSSLGALLVGEDPAFARHLSRLAREAALERGFTPPDLRAFESVVEA